MSTTARALGAEIAEFINTGQADVQTAAAVAQSVMESLLRDPAWQERYTRRAAGVFINEILVGLLSED
jgi:hypothetical protein